MTRQTDQPREFLDVASGGPAWGLWLLTNVGLVYALHLVLRLSTWAGTGQPGEGLGLWMVFLAIIVIANLVLGMKFTLVWRIAFFASAMLSLICGVWFGVLGFIPLLFDLPLFFGMQ